MEFKGDKESYPENEIIYPWRVTLRHKEELGKLRGVYSFEKLVSIIWFKNNHYETNCNFGFIIIKPIIM